jgi:hypothetical protein
MKLSLIMNGFYFSILFLDRINRILRIYLIFSKFPDEILKNQSAFSGKDPAYKYLLVISKELFISPKAIGYALFLPETRHNKKSN